MTIAIHQPHYFPWIGYFDKMAKVDEFILLDEVQFEKQSYMIRNRIVDDDGNIRYITISADTKGFLDREYRSINTKDNEEWTKRQKNAIRNYYRKAPYYDEIMPIMEGFLDRTYDRLIDWTYNSIIIIMDILEIKTTILFQSEIQYDRRTKKSDLVLELCKARGADTYFSGRGASTDYLDENSFIENNIDIRFQDFKHPQYRQTHNKMFISGLSILDMFFCCGIQGAKQLFWEGIKNDCKTTDSI